MRNVLSVLTIVLLAGIAGFTGFAGPAGADGHVLSPALADPQPSDLKPGLKVDYVYAEAKELAQAAEWLTYKDRVKPGPPLIGFAYGNSDPGQPALTSESDEFVIATIRGYMHFEPGTHELEFQSNDGLRVHIGGVQVYEHDLRHPCESNGIKTVKIAKAGWYRVEALFFQRRNTSCLDLWWKPEGAADWDGFPIDKYGHRADD